jgi:hypothetical protein
LDSLFDVFFPRSTTLLARKSVGLGRLERWLFTVGIALPTGTVFFPYATAKTISSVYFVSSVFAMTVLCNGAVLMFLSRKCLDHWTPGVTWRTLGCLAAGSVVHAVGCAGNTTLVAADGATASAAFAVGYVLLGLGVAQFVVTSATWLAQIVRAVVRARTRTTSSIGDVHVKAIHEAGELGHETKRRGAALGQAVGAVVDIGHHGETNRGNAAGHQRAAWVMWPARKSSTYGIWPGSGFQAMPARMAKDS